MKKKALFNFLLFIIFFSVLFSGNVFAQDAGTSAISRQTAELAISTAEKDIQEMDSMNFSTIQQKDILILAKNLYDADSKLESAGSKYDFSGVISKTEEISEIKKTAFLVFDELKALEEKTDEFSQDQNMKEAMDIFLKARQEFNDGRYSQSLSLIEECYSRISELSAVSAKIFAVYDAGTKTIAGFIKRNFIILSTIAIILLVSYFAFKRKIILFLFSKKKEKLELEKSILNELIQKAQSDYFEKGTLSEGSYRIRIQKFGELIRDIERKLSMINVGIGETMHRKTQAKEEAGALKNQITKEKKKLRMKNAGSIRKGFFRFLHAFGLARTKEEKKRAEELRKEKLERREAEKRKRDIEKKAQENAKLRELEKREAEKRKTEKAKEPVVMKKQEEPILTKEQKERTEERKRREYNRIKEEKIKEKEEKKKRMRRFRRKMIFNFLHALGLARTEEEKEKIERARRKRLARTETEKRKREAEKRDKEAKIIEYKRRSQEEIRRKQEAERARIESEKRAREARIREYERKKAERKKIKEEAKRRRARFRRRIIFNFMHALGLAKTKEEKEKIEKARKDRLARIEAEKSRRENEKKAQADAKRRIEAEKKNKEIAKQRLRELIIQKAKEAEIRKKKEEEIRIEGEKKRQEKAEQEKRKKKSSKKGRTLIFNLMHAFGLAKTEEEKERIAIRKRLGMLRKRIEEKVKRDRNK